MSHTLTLQIKTPFNAPVSKVWKAIVTPEIIKKYLFGTEVISDWKKGSPIAFRGSWEGKSYEDKGIILAIETEKLFRYTYWSSMSETPDIPENYAEVSYALSQENGQTIFTLTQGGIASEESKKHSEDNWKMVMGNLKKVLEESV
jgi:uncharacterized protein YndB with AHSA1/START domain